MTTEEDSEVVATAEEFVDVNVATVVWPSIVATIELEEDKNLKVRSSLLSRVDPH